MKSKTVVIVVGILLSLVLLAGTFSAGAMAGYFFSRSNPQQASLPGLETLEQTAPVSSTDTEELFVPFWQAYDIVHEFYYDQPVDDELLMRGAIRGMLDALGDQHSLYMDPQEYENLNTQLSGEYEGIGAWVNTDGDYLTIVEPIKGSPAEGAGLLPGDQIIAVDGEDVTGVLPEVVRQKVLGPKGSTVVLTIRRIEEENDEEMEQIFDVSLKRASIQIASVESEMLEGDIAYIKLRTFGQNTDVELKQQLQTLIDQNPKGLILDLRNNTGGLLTTAVEVASQFISEGVVLYEDYGDGTRDIIEAKQGGIATEIPMVVLVNEFSASASEVVAGAIQDYERGLLVGVTTFGKGSVQTIVPLDNEQGGVRVTIALWLTPNERQISEIGLTPDVEVQRTDEDFQEGRDPQLDQAIEILTQGE
jgi:carboxyl-terminal processing protease